uniref:Hexosyltransferase n=1 Tax=Ursus americanus TaxID=9643 RepID=A0A452RE76_URSAM
MGGPGVIMSREVLRRMVPHIGKCLREMYTTHEDVEVGRCVRRFAGVQCVWSYEVRTEKKNNMYCPFVSSFCGRLSSPECGLSFHFKCNIHMQIVNFKHSLISFFSCMVCVFCALCKKFFSSLGDRNCLQIFFCKLKVLSFVGSSSSFSFLRITSMGTCTI